MTVKSSEIRTITIEGVAFTPDVKGVTVPADKVKAVKENFFFKHYVETGAFTVMEEKTDAQKKAEAKAKAKKERDALIAEAKELELEFAQNIPTDALKTLVEEAKAK